MNSPLQDQKILVTGATGFLGSHLVRRLVNAGAKPTAVSRKNHDQARGPLEWVRADLTDLDQVQLLLNRVRPDVVFHLCSHGVGAHEVAHVMPTFRNDLMTTVNVLTAATKTGVGRLVLASSLEEPLPGSTSGVSSPYAAAKWAASNYARMFFDLYSTPVVLTRPYMTYGPGQRPHKLIPYVILALLGGKSPSIASGERLVDWVFIDDVADGLMAAAQVPGIEGCTVDLGTGALVPVKSVVEQLVQLLGVKLQPRYDALPSRPNEKVRAADTELAFAKLGWRAEVPLARGLQLTVSWYRQRQNSPDLSWPCGPPGESCLVNQNENSRTAAGEAES